MAQFMPRRVANETALTQLPIKEGQFIVNEETQMLYFDRSVSERILLGSANAEFDIEGSILQMKNKKGEVVTSVELPTIANAVVWNDATIEEVSDFGPTLWKDSKMKFVPVITANVNNINIKAGQFIYDTSTQSLYVDISDTVRRDAASVIDAYTKAESDNRYYDKQYIDDIMGDVVSLMKQL